MEERTVEDLTEAIVRDVTVGVADTGIRAGVVGEIGVEGDPITPNEEKSIRAAARASRITGAPISFHRGGAGAERRQTLDLVEEEGADLRRVILGHADAIADDLDLMVELLERGVFIQFDMIGREQALDEVIAVRRKPRSELGVTAQDAIAVSQLMEAGYEDRVLLSHDVCWKVHLKRYGGFGYSFVLERFLPRLREMGVDDPQIEKMMTKNPKRVLPLVEPQGLGVCG